MLKILYKYTKLVKVSNKRSYKIQRAKSSHIRETLLRVRKLYRGN